MKLKLILALSFLFVLVQSCQEPVEESAPDFSVEYEKFTLDNGLEVIFHIDRSDPVVAVALTAHVGSAREKAGRTGFAHLFEHLLFLESENLGKGGLDKMSARIGGSGANGSTSRDRTNYFQTVPKDALEKMIWAEADKLGWFINTVTDPVLAKEKQVVKNEKRQSVDNRPYGHTSYVIDKNLYPEDHPYNWQVIGSLEDLQNATLADVKEFFNRWYVPNNVTLTISGDFNEAQAKEWVHKYFDEIARGEEITPMPKRAGVVNETLKLSHEDNFARLPELTIVWPTVERYHPDSYPLAVLTEYLAYGKTAPLYQVLVEDKQLTSDVSTFNYDSELAGQLYLTVRAFEEAKLDDVLVGVEEAMTKFETEGISEKDLNRIKAVQETDFYNGLSSVLGKGFQLAQYNIFANDPGFVSQDIENILAVTSADVMRVYETYIKDKNFIATSFVPKGRMDLALTGSVKADVVEEQIVTGAEDSFDASISADFEPKPSSFDRSVEPPYGEAPTVTVPDVWEENMPTGLVVYGIESNEVPLVNYNILIEGGQLLESNDKLGVAYLTASLMTEGTANRTPAELEDAIQQLGATIRINSSKDQISVSVNTLARNYQATLDLVEEMLTQPRWDEAEFELLKNETISRIKQQQANPNSIAQNAYNRLLYGNEDIRAQNLLGSEESIQAISLDDLKTYYENHISQSVAKMHVVGAIGKNEVISSLNDLTESWNKVPVTIPELSIPAPPEESTVYFYDVPGAKQSVLRIGYPALSATDPDFYPATVANYILGGGGFASQLTQELREGKGYTYGISSRFRGDNNSGNFTISSGVRSNITLEATESIKSILENYGPEYSESDLETTKGYLIKSNSRAFETARAKLSMLEDISAYGYDYDYIKQREQIVNDITLDRIKSLSDEYFDPSRMIWLVVGDRETQFERMKELGYGNPVLINDLQSLEK